jgi:hypothetical protein
MELPRRIDRLRWPLCFLTKAKNQAMTPSKKRIAPEENISYITQPPMRRDVTIKAVSSGNPIH